MALRFTQALNLHMADSLVSKLLGPYAPTLYIYTGSLPGSFTDYPTGTELWGFWLDPTPLPWFTTTNTALTSTSVWEETVSTTGTAGCWALHASESGILIGGTCGVVGSGADLILPSTALVQGQNLRIQNFTINIGNQ